MTAWQTNPKGCLRGGYSLHWSLLLTHNPSRWISGKMTSEEWQQNFHTYDIFTTQIWVVLLIGWEFSSVNQKHYSGLGNVLSACQHGNSAVVTQTSFTVISGGVAKYQLFTVSQATVFVSHFTVGRDKLWHPLCFLFVISDKWKQLHL